MSCEFACTESPSIIVSIGDSAQLNNITLSVPYRVIVLTCGMTFFFVFKFIIHILIAILFYSVTKLYLGIVEHFGKRLFVFALADE